MRTKTVDKISLIRILGHKTNKKNIFNMLQKCWPSEKYAWALSCLTFPQYLHFLIRPVKPRWIKKT